MLAQRVRSCVRVVVQLDKRWHSYSDKRRLRDLLQLRLQERHLTQAEKVAEEQEDELPIALSTSVPEQQRANVAQTNVSKEKLHFPYERVCGVNFTSQLPDWNDSAGAKQFTDRGFHVRVDGHQMDEYIQGTTDELPLSKEYATGLQPGVQTSLYCNRTGHPDSVEGIFFQNPHQHSTRVGVEKRLQRVSKTELTFYGSENDQLSPSQRCCQGCGANFHCVDMSLPGFLPFEVFSELSRSNSALCRRCFLLKEYNFLVNVNVSRVDYEKIIGSLKLVEESLLLVLVDLIDFPGSVISNLAQLVGPGKSAIVLANKIDLLPWRTDKLDLDRVRKYVSETMCRSQFGRTINILDTRLISAKTGWGVESLISFINKAWANRGHIYLLGCTNAGKSTLFNTLLSSDLCKIRAVDMVERATTSIWPGTTLNLLKFPILNPTAKRVAIREARLRKLKRQMSTEQRLRQLVMSKRQRYSILNSYLGMSFKEHDCDAHSGDKVTSVRPWNPEQSDFKYGKWFYDTPGVISNNQILHLLTLQELIRAVPRQTLQARSYLLNPGSSLLVGGLARLEKPPGSAPTMLKVYVSNALPIYAMPTSCVHEFYARHLGTDILGVPFGDKERLSKFPSMQRSDIALKYQCSTSVDIVLSALGWISVKASSCAEENRYSLWTPLANGAHVRPSYL